MRNVCSNEHMALTGNQEPCFIHCSWRHMVHYCQTQRLWMCYINVNVILFTELRTRFDIIQLNESINCYSISVVLVYLVSFISIHNSYTWPLCGCFTGRLAAVSFSLRSDPVTGPNVSYVLTVSRAANRFLPNRWSQPTNRQQTRRQQGDIHTQRRRLIQLPCLSE